MPITYELINPSDKIFLDAMNLEIASCAMLLVGVGHYGLKLGDDLVVPVLGMGRQRAADDWYIITFGRPVIDSLQYCSQHHLDDVVACLRSFRLQGERSSLNDICGTAHSLAARMVEDPPFVEGQ